jgi:hypothetical protein
MNMARTLRTSCAVLLAVAALAAQAQRPIPYPAKGQSEARQSKDDGECYAWAKKHTGVDPANVAANPAQQETGPAVGGGERVHGAARGALGGAAIGAIAGDTGKGAGIGAGVGALAGGHRAREHQAERNGASSAAQQGALDDYNNAYASCMRGRGYSIG